MLSDFITAYAPQLIQTGAILTFVAPFLRKRGINDKNLISVFETVKATAKKINMKEIDIKETLSGINRQVSNIEKQMQDKVKQLDESILAFTESELYTKMLTGLGQMDELIKILEQKDDLIATLKEDIKQIRKQLGWDKWLKTLDSEN